MSQALEKEELLPLERLIEAPWNPNKIAGEARELLKARMAMQGPERTDAVRVAPIHDVAPDLAASMNERGKTLVVLDGNQRLQIARDDLGWKQLKGIVLEGQTPATARELTYVRDLAHGDFDPFLEADFLQWFRDQGQTEKEIAGWSHVSIGKVSRKLSIRRVDPKVRKEVLGEKSRDMGVSHLEVLATETPEIQRAAVAQVMEETKVREDRKVSVRMLEETVKELRARDELRREFGEAVRVSKFQRCPKDGGEPKKPLYRFMAPWVGCEKCGHEWSLATGEPRFKPPPPGSAPKAFPQHVKSPVPFEVFLEAARRFLAVTYPRFESVEHIAVSGRVDGKEAGFDLDVVDGKRKYSKARVRLHGHVGGETWALSIDPNMGAVKSFKTYLKDGGVGFVGSEANLKHIEKVHLAFATKYGKKERRKK